MNLVALSPRLSSPTAPAPSAAGSVASREADASEPPDVRDAFDHLAAAPLADGIDRATLLREARAAVADPGLAITQGTHPHTCVVTTLEYRLACQDPAAFLRLIEGLASPEGKASGGWARPDGCLGDDGTNRSLVDRLVQGALFSHTAFPGQRYDASHHAWTGPHPEPAEGLQPRQARSLLEDLTGDVTWQSVPGHEARTCAASIIRDVRSEGQTIPVALFTLGGDAHEVLVEDIQGDKIIYRDPEASRARPFEGAEPVDAQRGKFAIPLEDFEDQLASLAAPGRNVPAELWPPGAMYF